MTVPTENTLSLDVALKKAVASHREGRLQEAEQMYRAILKIVPAQPNVLHNFGILALQVGRYHDGLAHLKAAQVSHATHPQYTISYVEALLSTARTSEALEVVRAASKLGLASEVIHPLEQMAIEVAQLVEFFNSGQYASLETSARKLILLHPNCGFIWKALGASLQIQGKDAMIALRTAVRLLPHDAAAHSNLASALSGRGEYDEAMAICRRAIEIKPDFAEAYCNLGNTLRYIGKSDEAKANLDRALQLNPHLAEAHFSLGNFFKWMGHLQEAAACFDRTLDIKPSHSEAHFNLGRLKLDAGLFEAAIISFRRSLEIKADQAAAYCNLGSSLRGLGKLEEAETNYRQALDINPDLAEAHHNLGLVQQDLGELDAAVANFSSAQKLQPQALQHSIQANLVLPVIPETTEAIDYWRSRFEAGVQALYGASGTLKNPADEVNPISFYLAYQNFNDRQLMESLAHFFREKVPSLNSIAPHIGTWRHPAGSGRRIRVGFLTEFFTRHTITKLYQGFIRYLDRTRFEVIVIHAAKSKRDDFSTQIDAMADEALTLPPLQHDQHLVMNKAELDVLFYPDIGMTQSTYFLAYARFAPVQLTSWGHPNTTGLDTMDYFLSANCIEPENAQEHYTERLIRLNRIPCFYQLMSTPTEFAERAILGLPGTGKLYGSPQTLFKFHPDFDRVLDAIAQGDPTCHIVLVEGRNSAWVQQLKSRWEKNAPHLFSRALFLPSMPLDRFMMLMAHMDVLLDPIHFGSGNTLYEAMSYGVPVITWPGKFMRGRIVAGAYQQMGITDAPIAKSLEDYAPLAIALANDLERNRTLRELLVKASQRELFADALALHEFENFLEAALSAVGRGEKLPRGWRPGLPIGGNALQA